MRLLRFSVLFCLLFAPLASAPPAHASETAAEHAANVYAAQEMASHPVGGNLPDYSLSESDLIKGRHIETLYNRIDFTKTIWSALQILLLLATGAIAWMRKVATRSSSSRWIQGPLFVGLLALATTLLDSPITLYSHVLGLRYGFSVQGWGSWLSDQAKAFLIAWVTASLLVMLLFWIIRRFPRRWWLVFWAFSIPITFFGVFVSPYINFAFHKYEPLQKYNPTLVARLEQVANKGNMAIPPDRMFLMKASEKTTTMNADVEGFGASKRVVVWDTTIAKLPADELLGIFGHETGHYVLGHIRTGVLQSLAVAFVGLWLGFMFVQWALARFGMRWGIPSQTDWGTFAVLILAFSLLSIGLQPISNTLSRSIEHDADIYGQEVIHGLVADPQVTMQGGFVDLGKATFDLPNPSPFDELWLYNHPSIGRRAAFAHAYNPWAPGMEPKFFKADLGLKTTGH